MAAKWTKAKNVIWEELDGGALLIDARTGERWSLNATAAALWSWCDGHSSLGDLATRLSQSSRRTLREARAEVRAFCEWFAKENLLALANGSTSTLPGATHFSALNAPVSFNALGLGHGPRTRPGPRGNSSPG
jgi:coenzyme PQQ synthesis protein D (PqqD)